MVSGICEPRRSTPDRLWDPAPAGAARHPSGRRSDLLCLRRLRPDRHSRRGGPRARPDDSAGHDPCRLRSTLLLYSLVAIAALGTLGADRLARSVSPLAEITEVAGLPWAGVAVRLAAVVAAGGALLTLLAGISRTVFAMAQNRDLPVWLGAVDERRKTPYRAEIVDGPLGDRRPAR